MSEIIIKCTTSFTIPLSELKVKSGKLKKHSDLEIHRVKNSIIEDGFLFPLGVAKINGENIVVEGECRLYALQELEYEGYTIPEVPVFLIKCKESNLKKVTLIATSTNHMVTETSIKKYIEDTDLSEYVKTLGFNEGTLIDFHTPADMNLYEDRIGGKMVKEGVELSPDMFKELV